MFGIFRRIKLQGFAVFFAIYLLGLIAILIYGYVFTDNRLALFLLLFVWIMLYLCVLMAQITFGTRIKEFIMNIGVYERIRERRRLAAAAAVADQFEGQNLFETQEAREIPKAEYRCGNDSCIGYRFNEADNMYWIDSPPMAPGWYCVKCADGMRDKDRSERLNMGVFLTVLDYEAARSDRE